MSKELYTMAMDHCIRMTDMAIRHKKDLEWLLKELEDWRAQNE